MQTLKNQISNNRYAVYEFPENNSKSFPPSRFGSIGKWGTSLTLCPTTTYLLRPPKTSIQLPTVCREFSPNPLSQRDFRSLKEMVTLDLSFRSETAWRKSLLQYSKLIKDSNLTIKELATLSGCATATVHKHKNCYIRKPSINCVFKILAALGYSSVTIRLTAQHRTRAA